MQALTSSPCLPQRCAGRRPRLFSPRALLCLLALCLWLPACTAWAIYKCEADGKTTYGDAPCTRGARQQTVDTRDAVVNPVNAAQARERAAHERATLDQLTTEREKERREALAQEKSLHEKKSRLASSQRLRCETLAFERQRATDDVMTAPPRQLFRAQLAARRADERFQAACAGH
ncbi:MAG: DUF4124 domain-containing protein [Janthinobacterium lividum]